jgi:hypothetical protein
MRVWPSGLGNCLQNFKQRFESVHPLIMEVKVGRVLSLSAKQTVLIWVCASSALASAICPSGGMVYTTDLKSVAVMVYGFESHLGHYKLL